MKGHYPALRNYTIEYDKHDFYSCIYTSFINDLKMDHSQNWKPRRKRVAEARKGYDLFKDCHREVS